MDSVIHLLNNLGQSCKFEKLRLEIKTVIGRIERCNE